MGCEKYLVIYGARLQEKDVYRTERTPIEDVFEKECCQNTRTWSPISKYCSDCGRQLLETEKVSRLPVQKNDIAFEYEGIEMVVDWEKSSGVVHVGVPLGLVDRIDFEDGKGIGIAGSMDFPCPIPEDLCEMMVAVEMMIDEFFSLDKWNINFWLLCPSGRILLEHFFDLFIV